LWGKLELNEVRDYVLRLEPEFDEHRYGFGQFAELLTYAQDVGLVRLEPDADSVLRVFPGVQFSPTRVWLPAAESKPAAESEVEVASANGQPAGATARRRTYRRHSRKRAAPRPSPSP
jgi:hypothetical protein